MESRFYFGKLEKVKSKKKPAWSEQPSCFVIQRRETRACSQPVVPRGSWLPPLASATLTVTDRSLIASWFCTTADVLCCLYVMVYFKHCPLSSWLSSFPSPRYKVPSSVLPSPYLFMFFLSYPLFLSHPLHVPTLPPFLSPFPINGALGSPSTSKGPTAISGHLNFPSVNKNEQISKSSYFVFHSGSQFLNITSRFMQTGR
jgi:hypothetical protein